MNLRRQLFTLTTIVLCWPSLCDGQQIDVYFSPDGGAAAAIASAIDAAKTSIHVQAYAISESGITASLIAAHARGVDVQLIVDRHQQDPTYSTAEKIKKAGIQTLVDRTVTLMHNKSVVIDGQIVITGSMNLTRSGNHNNAENTVIIHDATTAAKFEADWTVRLKICSTFSRTQSKRRPLPEPLLKPQPSPQKGA